MDKAIKVGKGVENSMGRKDTRKIAHKQYLKKKNFVKTPGLRGGVKKLFFF